MATGKGATLLSDFEPVVVNAEEAKAAAAGTEEKKAARAAMSLADYLADRGKEEDSSLFWTLAETAEGLVGEVADLFDAEEGNKMADAIKSLLGIDEDYRPAGFDADKAEALVTRWKAATGRRGRGNGGGSIPESQKVPCPIKVVFDYPEGTDIDLKPEIVHASSWSSVSNEITKRARLIDGIDVNAGYKRPEKAAAEWKAIRETIANGGEGGTMTVPTEHGDLVATVTAQR